MSRPVFDVVPSTDDDIAPVFRLDEEFIRGAQFKEGSARQRARQGKRERRRPGPPRKRALTLADWTPPAVLALLVLAVCWMFNLAMFAPRSSPARPETTGADATGATTSTTFRLLGTPYDVGDCVFWEQAAGSSDRYPRVVPCDEPHLIEMTGRVNLSDRGSYPTDAEFEAIKQENCPRFAEEFLGASLDPYGRFQASSLTPYPEAWMQGEKAVWCGLLKTPRNADDDPHIHDAFTGSVKGQDQTYLWGAGSCLAQNAESKIIGIVPCDQPHAYEVTGHVDAGVFRTGPPPSDSGAWSTRLLTACTKLARTYFSGPLPAGVETWVLPFEAESWAAGRRQAECVLVRPDAAAKPTTLTASLRPTI